MYESRISLAYSTRVNKILKPYEKVTFERLDYALNILEGRIEYINKTPDAILYNLIKDVLSDLGNGPPPHMAMR